MLQKLPSLGMIVVLAGSAAAAGTAGVRPVQSRAPLTPQAVQQTAALVRSVLSMNVRLEGGRLTAPSQVPAAPAAQPLTLEPDDVLALSSFLRWAQERSPDAPPAPVFAPERGLGASPDQVVPLANVLALREKVALLPGSPREGLDEGASFELLSVMVQAVRRRPAGAARGRDFEALAGEIFDGVQGLAALAAPRPAAEAPAAAASEAAGPDVPVSVSPSRPALLPDSLLRAAENATLAGKRGDALLNQAFFHAFPHVLDNELQGRGPKDLGLAERVLAVALEVQGLKKPAPLEDWLARRERRPLAGSPLGLRLDAVNKILGELQLPTVSLSRDGRASVQLLRDRREEFSAAERRRNLRRTGTSDLRTLGGFLYNGDIYLLEGFARTAGPRRLAGALLALTLAQAGIPAEETAALAAEITGRAFARTGGAVTAKELAELAGAGSGGRSLGEKIQEALANQPAAPSVRQALEPPAGAWQAWKKRLGAMPGALGERASSWAASARRAARKALAGLKAAVPYLPAALLGAWVAAQALAHGAWPSVQSLFFVMVLVLGGHALRVLRPSPPPAAGAAAPAPASGRFFLDTSEAEFSRYDEAADRGRAVVEEAFFDVPEGQVSLALNRARGGKELEIYFIDPETYEQTLLILTADGERRDAKELAEYEGYLEVSDFLETFWPGLERALKAYLRDAPGRNAEARRIRRFFKRFTDRLGELGGEGAAG